MRDNRFLADRLATIHANFFAEVPITNRIFVRFGRATKNRLGSIIAKPHPEYSAPVTYIRINDLFRDPIVPEYVIDATLAHEFAHYTHGFHSPLPKKYTHPHRGNVVNKEIISRGAGHLLTQQDAWLKTEYVPLLKRKRMI